MRFRGVKLWIVLVFVVGFGSVGIYRLFLSHAASGLQIYRGVRNDGGDHYLSETSTAQDTNYSIEGPLFWAYPSQESGTVGVTRWWNGTYGAHYFSDGIHSNSPGDGWTSEGVRFYVPTGPSPHALAVYVARNPNNNDRVYSTSEGEINSAVANGWVDKSIAFYALDSNPANWGPTDNYAPTGNLDGPTPVTNCGNVGVWGWAKDDDFAGATEVHIYIDNQGPTAVTAGDSRGDVGTHGFNWNIPQGNYTKAGTHTVKAYAINYTSAAWASNSKNALIGQKSYTCPTTSTTPGDNATPTGHLDEARCDQGVWGWAKDDDYNGAIQVHIYADTSTSPIAITAGDSRDDVGAHGFNWSLPTGLKTNGTHTLRLYAINYDASGFDSDNKNALIGEKTYTCGSDSSSAPITSDVAPIGNVDGVTCDGVWGWAYDPNQPTKSIQVHIYVDGKLITGIEANGSRPDVVVSHAGVTKYTGFEYTWVSNKSGTHTVQVYGLNLDPSGEYKSNLNALLPANSTSYTCSGASASTATAAANDYAPGGNVDGISCSGVWGWTFDKDSTGTALQYHVYVDNVLQYGGVTATARSDVNSAYGIKGTHGFEYNLPDVVKNGSDHTVNIYGIDVNTNGDYDGGIKNALLGGTKVNCTSANADENRLETRSKFDATGKVDINSCKAVSGWAYDPDAKDKAIDVHVYIDGQGAPLGPSSFERSDVNATLGLSGRHGFNYTVPDSWRDGRLHFVDVYALGVDQFGNSSGDNPVIGQASWACDTSGNPIEIKPIATVAGGKGGHGDDYLYCPTSGPVLSDGSTGDDVTILQNCLASLHLNGGLGIGKFSEETKNSVILAQLAIPADLGFAQYARYILGVVDNATYGILAYGERKGWTASNPISTSGGDVNREGLPYCDLGFPESCVPPATNNREGPPPSDDPAENQRTILLQHGGDDLPVVDPDSYLLNTHDCWRNQNEYGNALWTDLGDANYYQCLAKQTELARLASITPDNVNAIYWDGKDIFHRIWVEAPNPHPETERDAKCTVWFLNIQYGYESYYEASDKGRRSDCIYGANNIYIRSPQDNGVPGHLKLNAGNIYIERDYNFNSFPDHVDWDGDQVRDLK